MIFANIAAGIAAALLLIGVIGEKNEQKGKNLTLAFVEICALIIALNTLGRQAG